MVTPDPTRTSGTSGRSESRTEREVRGQVYIDGRPRGSDSRTSVGGDGGRTGVPVPVCVSRLEVPEVLYPGVGSQDGRREDCLVSECIKDGKGLREETCELGRSVRGGVVPMSE